MRYVFLGLVFFWSIHSHSSACRDIFRITFSDQDIFFQSDSERKEVSSMIELSRYIQGEIEGIRYNENYENKSDYETNVKKLLSNKNIYHYEYVKKSLEKWISILGKNKDQYRLGIDRFFFHFQRQNQYLNNYNGPLFTRLGKAFYFGEYAKIKSQLNRDYESLTEKLQEFNSKENIDYLEFTSIFEKVVFVNEVLSALQDYNKYNGFRKFFFSRAFAQFFQDGSYFRNLIEQKYDEVMLNLNFTHRTMGGPYIFKSLKKGSVLLPTQDLTSIEVMNHLFMNGVEVISLIEKEQKADGEYYSILSFFAHDYAHANFTSKASDLISIYELILKTKERKNLVEKKILDLIFYYFWHENTFYGKRDWMFYLYDLFSFKTKTRMDHSLIRRSKKKSDFGSDPLIRDNYYLIENLAIDLYNSSEQLGFEKNFKR